jgi:hypothetical protein
MRQVDESIGGGSQAERHWELAKTTRALQATSRGHELLEPLVGSRTSGVAARVSGPRLIGRLLEPAMRLGV